VRYSSLFNAANDWVGSCVIITKRRRDRTPKGSIPNSGSAHRGGYSGLAMVGTSKTIADEMEEWLFTAGSDGFTVMFPYLPGRLDDFVEHVIPELQRRDLFRRDYEGTTLREHLGLPRPQNRFFPDECAVG
jgi:alkanesulfonate monooxygenase SsuD/methylene tetrahydromethanopterin reductase-like flavin-dependent oxidoreductase (luciferase family)